MVDELEGVVIIVVVVVLVNVEVGSGARWSQLASVGSRVRGVSEVEVVGLN